MNPYDYKREDFLVWLEKRMGKYGYTVKKFSRYLFKGM